MASPSLLRDILDYTKDPRFATSTPEERWEWLSERPSISMSRQFVETVQTLPETPEAETFEEAVAATPQPVVPPSRMRNLTASRLLDTYAARQDAPAMDQPHLLRESRRLATQIGASDVWETTGDKEQVAAYVARNIEKIEQDLPDVQQRAEKRRDFFSQPKKAQEWLGLLDNLAKSGGVFGSPRTSFATGRMMQGMQESYEKLTGEKMPETVDPRSTVEKSMSAWTAPSPTFRTQTGRAFDAAVKKFSEQTGVSEDESRDLIRHRTEAYDGELSRDSFGTVHYKTGLLLQGPDKIKEAIKNSDLSLRVKDKELAGVDRKYANFQRGVVDNFIRNHPDVAKETGIDKYSRKNPNEVFELLRSLAAEGVVESGGGGFAGALTKTLAAIDNLRPSVPLTPGLSPTAASGIAADTQIDLESSGALQKISDTIQASVDLGDFFYEEKNKVFGVPYSMIGQVGASAVESIVLGSTGGALAVKAIRATPFWRGASAAGKKILDGAVSSGSVGAVFGAREGLEMYEQAQKAGFSESEAVGMGLSAFAIEFLITGAFGALGAGGLEKIGTGLNKEAISRSVQEARKQLQFVGTKQFLGSLASELPEETLIEALNMAINQTKLDPDMTVAEYTENLRRVAIATLFSTGPIAGLSASSASRQAKMEQEKMFTPNLSTEELESISNARQQDLLNRQTPEQVQAEQEATAELLQRLPQFREGYTFSEEKDSPNDVGALPLGSVVTVTDSAGNSKDLTRFPDGWAENESVEDKISSYGVIRSGATIKSIPGAEPVAAPPTFEEGDVVTGAELESMENGSIVRAEVDGQVMDLTKGPDGWFDNDGRLVDTPAEATILTEQNDVLQEQNEEGLRRQKEQQKFKEEVLANSEIITEEQAEAAAILASALKEELDGDVNLFVGGITERDIDAYNRLVEEQEKAETAEPEAETATGQAGPAATPQQQSPAATGTPTDSLPAGQAAAPLSIYQFTYPDGTRRTILASSEADAVSRVGDANAGKPKLISQTAAGSAVEGARSIVKLHEIAVSEGVDVTSMTREEYVDYAIKHGVVLDSDAIRMQPSLRAQTDVSDAYEAARMRSPYAAKGGVVDTAYDALTTALKNIRNKAVDVGVALKQGYIQTLDHADGWVNFGIKGDPTRQRVDHDKTHKAYFNFGGNFGKALTLQNMKALMLKLHEAGFNGQLKVGESSSQMGRLADQMVIHGQSQTDAQLAQQVVQDFFATSGLLLDSNLGIDTKGKSSYSEELAAKTRDAAKAKAATQTQSSQSQTPAAAPKQISPQKPTDSLPAGAVGLAGEQRVTRQEDGTWKAKGQEAPVFADDSAAVAAGMRLAPLAQQPKGVVMFQGDETLAQRAARELREGGTARQVPATLSKGQRASVVAAIQKRSRNPRETVNALAQLSPSDVMSITEKLDDKTLRWLTGGGDKRRLDMLSSLRESVNGRRAALQSSQEVSPMQDDVVRRPVDRVAARVTQRGGQEGEVRFQSDETPKKSRRKPRGTFTLVGFTQAFIGLNSKRADIGTLVHELMHLVVSRMLNPLLSEKERGGITDNDLQVVYKDLGVEKAGPLTREQEERLVAKLVGYLYQGLVPQNSALKPIFDKIAQWLQKLHSVVTRSDIDLELSPEMREIFDRIFTLPKFKEATKAEKKRMSNPIMAAPIDTFAAKHAFADFLRDTVGLPNIPRRVTMSDAEGLEKAEQIVNILKKNPTDPKSVVNKLQRDPEFNPGKVDQLVLAAEMGMRFRALQESERRVQELTNESSLETVQKVNAEHAKALEYFEEVVDMIDMAGSRAGLALQARKVFIKVDMSQENILRRLIVGAKRGDSKPISPERLKKMQETAKDLSEQYSKVYEERTRLEEEIEMEQEKAEADSLLDSIRKKVAEESTKKAKKAKKQNAEKRFSAGASSLRNRVQKQISNARELLRNRSGEVRFQKDDAYLSPDQPLPGAPKVKGATGPDLNLVKVAEEYAKKNNIPFSRQAAYAQINEELAKRIAEEYEKLVNNPSDPLVREAYENLIKQTRNQYDALVEKGYKFFFYDGNSDPYGGKPWEAMRDLRQNKKMSVFGTYAGFGTNESFDTSQNPMLADTGLSWPDQFGIQRKVLANDLFRAVHDAFGHGLEGAGFRAQGEENAWQAHVRLFTGSAIAAITTETRGQNSWLNYGPYGEKNRTAKTEDTVFADQKIGLLPSWTWETGRVGNMGQPLFQSDETPADFAEALKLVAIDEIYNKTVNSAKDFEKLVREQFGEDLVALAKPAFDAAVADITEEIRNANIRKSASDMSKEIDVEKGLSGRQVWNMVRAVIEEDPDIKNDDVLLRVTEIIKQEYPEVTFEEVRQAFTNYGVVKEPDQEEISKRVRALSRLTRITQQLEDIRKGQSPKKTGMQRDDTTAEERILMKERQQLMKDLKINSVNEESLKSSRDAAKKKILNMLEELQLAIDTKQRLPENKRTIQQDTELDALREQLAQKRAEYDAIFNPNLELDQQVERAGKMLDKLIAEEEEMVRKGVVRRIKEKKAPLQDPRLEDRQKRLKELREIRSQARAALEPKKSPQQVWEDRMTASVKKSIEEMEKIIQSGQLPDSQQSGLAYDPGPELKQLLALRDSMAEVVEEMRKRKRASLRLTKYEIAERNAIRGAEKTIAKIVKRITSNDFTKQVRQPGLADSSPQVQAIKQVVADLKETEKQLKAAQRPRKSPDQIYNERAMKAVEIRIKNLQEKLANKDFRKEVKPSPIKSVELMKKLKEEEDLKLQVREEATKQYLESIGFAAKTWRFVRGVANLRKLLLLGAEPGAIFRQAMLYTSKGFIDIITGMRYVVTGNWEKLERNAHILKTFARALRAGIDFSEETEFALLKELQERPGAAFDKIRGVKYHSPFDQGFLGKEDVADPEYARIIAKWVNKYVTPGKLRALNVTEYPLAFERFIRVYLNYARAHLSDALTSTMVRNQGSNPLFWTQQEHAALGLAVNVATGRWGSLKTSGAFKKSLDAAVPFLNEVVFISARWSLSRASYLTFGPLRNMTTWRGRAAVAKELYVKPLLGYTLRNYVMYLAYQALAESMDDPEEKKKLMPTLNLTNPLASNFGAMKVGDMTVDMSGGLVPFAKIMAFSTSPYFSKNQEAGFYDDSGKWTPVSNMIFEKRLVDFFKNRMNVNTSYLYRTFFLKEYFGGEKVTMETALLEFVSNALVRETMDLYRMGGPQAVAGWLQLFTGDNVNVRPPKPPKPTRASRSTGGDLFAPSSRSGSTIF